MHGVLFTVSVRAHTTKERDDAMRMCDRQKGIDSVIFAGIVQTIAA